MHLFNVNVVISREITEGILVFYNLEPDVSNRLQLMYTTYIGYVSNKKEVRMEDGG